MSIGFTPIGLGCCIRGNNNGPTYYDYDLQLLLSTTEQSRSFYIGNKNISAKDRWMNIYEQISSNIIGHTMGGKNYLITKIYFQAKEVIINNEDNFIKFNLYNSPVPLYNFNLFNNELNKEIININLVVNHLHELKLLLNTTDLAKISYPTVWVYLREIF